MRSQNQAFFIANQYRFVTSNGRKRKLTEWQGWDVRSARMGMLNGNARQMASGIKKELISPDVLAPGAAGSWSYQILAVGFEAGIGERKNASEEKGGWFQYGLCVCCLI